MKKIALVEDDEDLFKLVKYNLQKEGFQFVGAMTGTGALEMCAREKPDLVLLDIMLPDFDGFEICRQLRRTPGFETTPIIFVTARAAETERILGLELGANDYIVKPFFMRELIARVRVQLRSGSDASGFLSTGGLELDQAARRVTLNGRELELTATEFRLLEFLMSRKGVVFSRAQLLDAVWGYQRNVTERTVDVFILRLRQKIEQDPAAPKLIRSVRAFGYSFESERNTAA